MSIKLYWCRGKGRNDPNQRNFGDYLSPMIVEMVSGKSVEHAPIDQADLMAIGSILPRERKARRFLFPSKLNIWGAGTDAPDLMFSSQHHYHALRGVKSVEQVKGLKKQVALGDPGLLANYWWDNRPKPTKDYKVGLIPHYVDQTNPVVIEAAKRSGVLLIDVFWPVEEVLRAIQKCDFILSSSMHGLIVADSFGVPNRRVKLSEGKISDYKFVDYYSSFSLEEPTPLSGSDLETLHTTDVAQLIGEYKREKLDELQKGLLESFPRSIGK